MMEVGIRLAVLSKVEVHATSFKSTISKCVAKLAECFLFFTLGNFNLYKCQFVFAIFFLEIFEIFKLIDCMDLKYITGLGIFLDLLCVASSKNVVIHCLSFFGTLIPCVD